MKKLFALTMALLLLGPIAGSRGQQTSEADLRAANDAWQEGKYTTALRAYLRLLRSTAGDELLEPITRQTGELFQTEELTTDGRAPRLSPRGNFISYETGSGLAALTRIISAAAGHAL